MPKYEELKEQIYKMQEGINLLLSQTFDKIKKEIVLRLIYETVALKNNDPTGFRSLQAGFEVHFLRE